MGGNTHYAVPASTISALSSGEFVGMVADNPDCKIPQKVFHTQVVNDHEAIKVEESGFKPIPEVRSVSAEDVRENYLRVKLDVQQLIDTEVEKINERLLGNMTHGEGESEGSSNGPALSL